MGSSPILAASCPLYGTLKRANRHRRESTQCDLIEKARLGFNKHTSDKCLFVRSLKAPYETAQSTKTSAIFGGLIATARNTVLKTVGTASTRMGIDTSALRQRPLRIG